MPIEHDCTRIARLWAGAAGAKRGGEGIGAWLVTLCRSRTGGGRERRIKIKTKPRIRRGQAQSQHSIVTAQSQSASRRSQGYAEVSEHAPEVAVGGGRVEVVRPERRNPDRQAVPVPGTGRGGGWMEGGWKVEGRWREGENRS